VNGVKSITLRLPKDEYLAFDAICVERGYSKTGKIREFIRNLVKEEIEAVSVSAGEWSQIEGAIKEIKGGKFTSFEELKRDFAEKKLGNKKGS
jgi:hypothetical protein